MIRHCFLIFLQMIFILPGIYQTAFAAQTENYDFFYHVRTSGIEVSQIRKDPTSGIIWLATSQGLLKYGDAPFAQAAAIVPEDISMSLRTVSFFGDGNLLVRTKAMSYKVYDEKSHRVVVNNLYSLYPEWDVESDDPYSTEIYDGKNVVWIKSGPVLYSHPLSLKGKADLRIRLDDDILYVLDSGDYVYILTADELIEYDAKSNKIHKKLKWNFPVDTRNLRMVVDGKNNVWICNENLYRCDFSSGRCEEILPNISATDMTVSSRGNVYVSTNTRGIVAYDFESNSLNVITSNPYDTSSLLYDRLKSIYIDDNDNLWVSYSKQGLSLSNMMLSNNKVYHIPTLHQRNIKDDIISAAYDRDGHLWLGTDGYGLYSDKDNFNRNMLPPSFTNGKEANNPVTSIFFDSKGNLWTGVFHKGLVCLSPDGWKVMLQGMSPYDIVEDMYGNIYVATLGTGLYLLSPEKNYEPVAINVEGRKYISQLVCSRSHNLYILFPAGLGIYDTVSGNSEFLTGNRRGNQKFKSQDLQTMLCDSRGLIWLASADGYLEVLNLQKDELLSLDMPKGMRVISMMEDDSKNVWILSNLGAANVTVGFLSKNNEYSFNTSFFKPRMNHDEFRHFNIHSAAKSPNGAIVFGSTDGYMLLNPNFYYSSSENNVKKADLVALRVNNTLINPGSEYNGRVLLDKDLSEMSVLKFKSDENNISFVVHSQDYGSPFETDYYYFLDGLSDSWLPIENNTIDLTNLPVGSYDLKVSFRNPDGSLSAPVTSLKVRVDAPWYLSIWAMILYSVIFITIIGLVIYQLSERKNHRLRLEQAEKEMQRQYQINEMKLRFFTNISHDFRTPLTLIITPLEAYLNNKKNNPDVKFFTPIYRNAVRLLNLINQILDFRKLEVCGDSLNLSNGDVVRFVDEICSSFTIFAEDSNVTLNFSSNVNSLQMAFDRDKLSKILMNLLSNAFKHTPKSGIVNVCVTSCENSTVRISVSDNGPGVADSEKNKIFDRFYQNKCDNSANMGSGVGLHIVREYVRLHDGDVSVADNPDGGAVFTVVLPIRQVENVESEPQEKPVGDSDGIDIKMQEGGSRQTILLVEDNVEFLDFLQQSLDDEYNVLRATDGILALEVLKNNNVDIVISDIMMDNMDGLELCGRIKNDMNLSHIPVILLTAKSMIDDEITGLETGADDYITKPFSLSVLKARIQSILRARERYRKKFNVKTDVKPSEIAITPLDQQFLTKALAAVEERIADASFSVEDLSDALGMHRANLYRKLHSLTGKSPIEFIRVIKLRRACQYLEKSQMYISEIAYAVGFNSPKLFAKYFKDEYGMSPREYKQAKGNGGDIDNENEI